MKRIKIAYLCVNDPLDKRSWSGITYYLGQGLQRNVADVDFLGPVKLPWIIDKITRAIAKFTRIVFKKEYHTRYSLLVGWYASRALKKKMKGKRYDCVVAPAASTEFAFFRSKLPCIYFSDTTFDLISNLYKNEFGNISSFSRWEGNFLERKSLNNASLVILSSDWAKRSAIERYGVSARKIEVMPLGANMDFTPSRDMIFEKEKNTTLTLLYLAVDWERKGGSIAFDTLKQLHATGVHAKLIVCGCIPPPEFSHPFMEVVPFLNKNIEKDHQKFIQLLSTSHFLLLPTRGDCSLLVACESNAYGMPAISSRTGGVPDLVKDGINGYCLPYEAGGKEYAELVARIFNDKEKYHQLIRTSREKFEHELNWDKWSQRFAELYHRHILQEQTSFVPKPQKELSN